MGPELKLTPSVHVYTMCTEGVNFSSDSMHSTVYIIFNSTVIRINPTRLTLRVLLWL